MHISFYNFSPIVHLAKGFLSSGDVLSVKYSIRVPNKVQVSDDLPVAHGHLSLMIFHHLKVEAIDEALLFSPAYS